MRNKIRYIRLIGLIFVLIVGSSLTFAQNKSKRKSAKKPLVEVVSIVTDEKGSPLKNVSIICGEGAVVLYTDAKGRFQTKVENDATVMVEALGYEDKVYKLTGSNIVPEKIVLKKEPLFLTEESLVNRADGGKTYKGNEVGATSVLENGQFGTFPDLTLTNMLQGKMLGLQVRSTVSGLGNNTPDLFIRGQHGMSENTAIVIIDGVERPAADLIPEEIERIELLKDATAKILYGARAANGVLWVTTRRGKANRRIYNATAEAGVVQMTRTPDFLNSYQYANLYNEARANDGLTPYYNQKQLEGYKNSKGANDLLYPNVDLYDQLLNKNANYRKVSFDMTGGTDRVRYALIAGYVGGSGFEDVTYTPQLHRLTLRGNLDFNVTDFLTISADVAGRMEMRKWGQLDCGQVFTALSTHRPNEYPLTMSPEETGLASSDGIPLFGASLLRPMNAYAETMYGGYTDERYTRSQTNIGLKFDLDMLTKGLKAGAFLSFDNYDYLQLSLSKVYPTYAIKTYRDFAGEEQIMYTQMKKTDVATSQSRKSTTLQQTLGWNAFAGYENTFNQKHDVSARLTYMYSKTTNQGVTQDIINANYALRLNYMYDRRYAVEADMALMGSNRFKPKIILRGMKKINEIFYSIQGEGYRTGTPAVFVRFSGCNLKCPFCDTQHSSGREMSDEEIIKEVCFYPTRFVVLTGGEPGLQVDQEFINKLHQAGKFVQIETNGTVPLPIGIDWITCSPKEGSKVFVVNPHEIKVVYTGQDLSTYEAMTAAVYYLQPCSCQNTEEVINYVKEHPKWKLSLQTQKILNMQ